MVKWIVDEILNERLYETGFPTIAEAAKELGHSVYQTKYVPFSKEPDWRIAMHAKGGECAVVYGSVEFCKQIEKHFGRWWTPGLYFNDNVKRWSKFAPYIGKDLLNWDYVILPYADMVRRLGNDDGVFIESAWFIKPELGLKEFTGQILHSDDLEEDLKKLSPYHTIDPTTLCVVADPKDIKAEFRYVIANRKVVTGSEYRWGNVLDVRRDTHPICDAMANKIAKAEWQADTVYICDIALRPDDTAKVVELNAFSSSGLYACDPYKIVEAVSSAASKEFMGELEDE